MRLTSLSLMIALPLLASAPALAAGPAEAAVSDARSSDQADVLFRKGKTAFDAGKVVDAYAFYQSAWAIKQTHDVAGNLAQAEIRLGKARDAAEHLTFALTHFPPSVQSDRREGLRKVLDGLRRQLGTLHVKASLADAKVSIDGKALDASQSLEEVFVEAGSHTVVAELAGYADATMTVLAAAGSSQEVALDLVKVRPPPKADAPIVTAAPRPVLMIVSGVIAAGGLAAGIGLTVAANGKSADADALGARLPGRSSCAGAPEAAVAADCKALRSTLTEQSTLRNAALVSFATGGALALVTAGLGVWKLKAPTRAGALQITPVLGSRDGGIIIGGTW